MIAGTLISSPDRADLVAVCHAWLDYRGAAVPEVYGIPQDILPAVLAPLGRVEPVGQSFPVYKVAGPEDGGHAIDVALPRRESKRGRGHKAFDVEGDPFMSPEDAARRRDFTINAISWNPLTDEYQDPFDGRRDLAQRRLRAVDLETFGDDSLRVLRATWCAAREPPQRAT